MLHKKFRFGSILILTLALLSAGFFIVPQMASCSPVISQMSEEQAAQLLRTLTKDGKLPPEGAVLDIENRFAKTKTGALAKLLRARIHFEASDFTGAAEILNSDVFRRQTTVADYALWLRGKSLQSAGNQPAAMDVFAELIRDFPDSLRARESKMLWAASASATGKAAQIPAFLKDLTDKNQADALLATAKSYEAQANQPQAIDFYRRAYFYGAGGGEAKEAEAKLTAFGQNLAPQSADEIRVRADKFYAAKNYAEAANAYNILLANFPAESSSKINLKRVIAYANLRKFPEAQIAFNQIPQAAAEKPESYYQLALTAAKNRQTEQTRTLVEELRGKFPASEYTPKTLIAVGLAARDAGNKADESYFLKSAVASYPNAIDVAGAQFELAWLAHENNDFPNASQMLVEHLARYVDRDSTNRGKAGYWAARDSEKAAKINEACALYDAVNYRYGANWYGYLAIQRVANLRAQGKCQTAATLASDSLLGKAVANLKTVTVAPETATAKELTYVENADELGTIGLFDWAIDELQEAKKTAANSPKINLALARHYRFRGDNVSALLALAKSYPDYSQMFPEEMSAEEWSVFYPLTNWNDIKKWAAARNLDVYQVAGLIRQESVFNPRAKSGANAYGLMQLLIPTARSVAKKYGSTQTITGESLFQPALNIELGTAYMRDQLDKFGRIEYVAAAYNAGPGRVPQWRATLPFEMDEFVEEIPFRETKAYVQGVIRNSAQYRRLYDDNGKFKKNVGTKPVRGALDSLTRDRFAAEFPEVVPNDAAE